MAQRTFTLTGTATTFDGNPLGNAPCSFAPILPGVSGAMIDGAGDFVSMAPVAFRTNPDGTFPTLSVDYPGDFQTAYQAAQVRVTVNGVVTDSPIGFGYASSIDFTDWINATTSIGLVVMRAIYTKDDGTPIPGAIGSVSLSDSATVVASGDFRSSNNPVQSVAATDGTMTFSIDPNSLLNPSDLGYILQISGEPRSWQFKAPAVVDVYRGAYNAGTTYHGASGSSSGDVVSSGGVLYRFINATPSAGHAPPNATYWVVVSGLPTDLIAAHLTLIGPSNGTIIGTTGVSASPNLTPEAGDPFPSPGSLDDDLVNLAYRIDNIETGVIFSLVEKTANYTITPADSGILANTTSATFTVTLPTAVSAHQTYTVKLKPGMTNPVNVGTTSSQTIDGVAAPMVISNPGEAFTFASDNANWYVV